MKAMTKLSTILILGSITILFSVMAFCQTETPLPIYTEPNQSPTPTPEPTITPGDGHFFCWVYVQTEDNLCDFCDIASHAQEGDVVDILKDRPQDQPTTTEASHWAICMVELTQEEINQLKETMYAAQNPEPTPVSWFSFLSSNLYAQEDEQPEIIAYRKYQLTDLAELGLDTKGVKQNWKKLINEEKDKTKKDKLIKDKDDFKAKFKSKIKEKKQKDIDDWKQKKKEKNQ